ncbi:MAG: hypothetical protein IKE92_09610 [Clostridiales bacterium]|nr:hypothetical protein [Clostridiales bacterium]
MDNSEKNLVLAFAESLFEPVFDIGTDVAEVAVDSLFEDGSILEAIPVVKIICAVGKAVLSVRDKYLCKRLAVFIQEFNNGKLSQKQIDKHKEKLLNENRLEAECERILLLIDQSTYESQTKYLCRFYQAYINQDISWEKFQELAEANQRMFIGDYSILKDIVYKKIKTYVSAEQESNINRLISLGLINDYRLKNDAILLTAEYKDTGIQLTEFGKVFGRYLDVIEADGTGASY